MGAWNPWRRLRHLDDVELVRSDIAPLRGHISTDGLAALIILGEHLGRRQRNAVLAHELVHLERVPYPDDAPAHLVAREERVINDEVAWRIVDTDRWQALQRRPDPVMGWEVADELDIPEEVAWRRAGLDDDILPDMTLDEIFPGTSPDPDDDGDDVRLAS